MNPSRWEAPILSLLDVVCGAVLTYIYFSQPISIAMYTSIIWISVRALEALWRERASHAFMVFESASAVGVVWLTDVIFRNATVNRCKLYGLQASFGTVFEDCVEVFYPELMWWILCVVIVIFLVVLHWNTLHWWRQRTIPQ